MPLGLPARHYCQSTVDRMPSADCLHGSHVVAHTCDINKRHFTLTSVLQQQDASKCEMKPINTINSDMSPDYSHFRITDTIMVEPTSCGLINKAIRYPLYPPFMHTHIKLFPFLLFLIKISFYKILFQWKFCHSITLVLFILSPTVKKTMQIYLGLQLFSYFRFVIFISGSHKRTVLS